MENWSKVFNWLWRAVKVICSSEELGYEQPISPHEATMVFGIDREARDIERSRKQEAIAVPKAETVSLYNLAFKPETLDVLPPEPRSSNSLLGWLLSSETLDDNNRNRSENTDCV